MRSNHHIDGLLAAVPDTANNKTAYRDHARICAALLKEYGALHVMECRDDDVPQGKASPMPHGLQCTDNETAVFSWVIWPRKAIRDADWQKLMTDPRMPKAMPLDGTRLICGGFVPLAL